ncbi:MAG: ATP-binding protein [Dactylosporangium sp.]|nr:ATP-binding protein [Dactylosporangium sp.]NNJ61386.1 ATP-binding protein [Dactylosporangium sp.]
MRLLERDRELGKIAGLLAGAVAGRGATVLVEGAPGIGKTALLAAVRKQADSLQVRSLTASGGELEQQLGFAIVRQLFDPPLRAVPAAERTDLLSGAAGLAASVFDGGLAHEHPVVMGAVVHGLFWLCSNLAERHPLLLIVDDVQWTDEASLPT